MNNLDIVWLSRDDKTYLLELDKLVFKDPLWHFRKYDLDMYIRFKC